MAKKYGNTWWGQKWLDSLNKIDYSSRLPRGRSYANKGAVLDVEITNKGQVFAKVQGSRRSPYKQSISIQQFSGYEKEVVLDLMVENPFILSSLMNRVLPQELFTACESKNIRIFPASWEDMTGECSCPDWAVPCKHLAAVIYIVGNEIDKNPFLVFQLRGIDILQELEKRGFVSQTEATISILSLSQLFPEKEKTHTAYTFQESLLQKIDFSTLPESKLTLLKLLSEKPVFYTKNDFKTLLDKNYTTVSKGIKRLKKELAQAEEAHILPTAREKLCVHVDEYFRYDYLTFEIEGEEQRQETKEDIFYLIQKLHQVPREKWAMYSPSVIAFYFIHQFSLYLLEQGAVIPQLIHLQGKKYSIRWVPALLIEEVQQIFKILQEITPPDSCCLVQKKQKKYASAETQVISLLSLFLNYYMEAHSHPAMTDPYDDVLSAFFAQVPFNTQGFEKQELANAIQTWLSKFQLTDKKYVPLIKIEEPKDTEGFLLSFWIENREEKLEEPIPLQDLLLLKKYQAIRMDVLQDFVLLADYFPQVQQVLHRDGEEKIEVDPQELVNVLLHIIPALQILGIKVLLPKTLQKLARPQLSMRMSTKGSVGSSKGFVNMSNLLAFDWQIALGEDNISPVEFMKLAEKMQGIVKINGQYVLIDQKEMEALLKKLDNPPKVTHSDLLRASLSEDYKGAKVQLDSKVKALLEGFTQTETIAPPQNLQATLRPYQQRGYEWLYKNATLGFGSLLADDMGLGKTIQVITLLLQFKAEGKLDKEKALVVVPTTLLTNWEKEIKKFAPDLHSFVYHGPKRKLEPEKTEVVLTTYGVARSDHKELSKIKWAFLGIDEAQNIKNTQTAQSKAIKKMKAGCIVAMSGTPVENRLSEYWSIFDFTNKGYLDTLKRFTEEYIKPIELDRNREVLQSFRKVTAPFILRRVKTDKTIIQDLPDKVEMDQICRLTKEQSAIYQSVVEAAFQTLEEQEKGIERSGMIFQMMIALKQICNHPSNYLKKKTIDPELSGKTQMLLSLLDSIQETGEKTLIFTQYKEMGDLLARLIQEKYQTTPLWLHGGVSRKKRDTMVEDFQTKPHIKTMILSLKAAGTGLNLTQANHVIHYDLWWNPAVENQATDRAYRIGQKKNVLVYRMITKGTFEEKINEMIQKKKELAEMTVSTGENWIGNMNHKELKEIFRLEG